MHASMPEFVRTIDLFCGAGGLSVGFEQLTGMPFKTVWANDFNVSAADTFNLNFGPVCRAGDIVNLLQEPSVKIPHADVVIGGPPCQGFSLLNKRRSDDPRKKLWIPFMEVVARSGARLFLMENVPQLLGSLEHQEILAWAAQRGFALWSGALVAADYGVPQTRKRAFIVGSMDADPAEFFPPPPTHHKPGVAAVPTAPWPAGSAADSPSRQMLAGESAPAGAAELLPWCTVADAIKDLPPPEGTEIREIAPPLDLQFGRNPTEKSRARYRAIPEQGMNRLDLQREAPELTPDCWIRKTSGGTDLFGRLWWDRPAFTIRTEFYKPEKGRYLHPEQHRPITHREAARFQSFPDSFRFSGTKVEIARQIGNAVPPQLAAALARQMLLLYRAVARQA